MQNYNVKKILVPIDGSNTSLQGLDKAIYFARRCNAEIKGLCVAYVPPKLAFEAVQDTDSATRKKIDAYLKDAKTTSAKNGINFEGVVDHGQPGPKIIEHANHWNCDLIVMGSRGAGSSEESFIGSVANYVIQKTTIPVIIVK